MYSYQCNVKGRKDHMCFFCGNKIEKGSQYIYHKVYDSSIGVPNIIRMHEECSIYTQHFCSENYEDGITENEFIENVLEDYIELFGERPKNVPMLEIVKSVITELQLIPQGRA